MIVKETLANGRLTNRGGISLLAEATRERGTTPDALALAAVVAQPWADIVTVEMLESNLAALGFRSRESSTLGWPGSPRSRRCRPAWPTSRR